MDINQTIQWVLGLFTGFLSIVINHFGELLLLAMIIYVILHRKQMALLWKDTYDRINKKMDVPFNKIESMVTKKEVQENANGTTSV